VQTAMKSAAEDQQQIANHKRDIESQRKMLAQTNTRERMAKEAVTKIKVEISELASQIEEGSGMSHEQELQLRQLQGQKDQLEKDREMLRQNTEMLQTMVTGRLAQVQRAEKRREDSEEAITTIKQQIEDKRAEVEAEKRRKEELEQKMKDLREENELLQEEYSTLQRNIQNGNTELKKVEADVAEAEAQEERLEKRVRHKVDEKRKLEEKLEQELARNEKYVQENEQRHLQKRAKEEEIQQHKTEKDKVLKLHEALKSKDKKVEDERKQAENNRNQLRSDMKDKQDLADSLKRDGDADRKKIEDLLRERDILNKNVIKADDRTKQQIDLVKRQETQALNLRKDIARWKRDAQDFKNRVADLEVQREKYGIELSQANAKYFAAKEDMKMKGAALTELNKQIATVQAKRNQQKNLYDAVCMDRNKHAKDCMQSKEEIAEMRRKFTVMFHQTAALKEEIREKDNDLVKGHFKHNKVREQIEKLKAAKEKAERREKNLKNIVETQKTQMKKLESTIQEAEQERQAQQKELEGVIGERDILGAQLIRRNEELALLYEKIKIQQSTLQNGEIQYADRVKEVDRLRGEIRKTKADVALARAQVTNVDSLKREVHHLSKTLLREETKLKALQEEMANPMNVHRWRELEGSDPQTYEMIQRVKNLQKLLIQKTEEVVEKDALIQEKEKLYVQLKSIIARQPGPEVAEQLAWYSQNLKEKTRHMKQMAEELETYHNQVQDLRDEIDRHNKDLASVKQAYFHRLRQARQQQMV
jgi:chromosome segregation ATPase